MQATESLTNGLEQPFRIPESDKREETRKRNLDIYSYGIDDSNYKRVLELDPNLRELMDNILKGSNQNGDKQPEFEADLEKMEKITKLFSLISLDRGLGKDQTIKIDEKEITEPACLMPKRNKLLSQIRGIFDRRQYGEDYDKFVETFSTNINTLTPNAYRYGGDEFCISGHDENNQMKLYMLDVANLKGSDNAGAGNFYLTSIGNLIQKELEKLPEGSPINDQIILEIVSQINSSGRGIPTKSSPDDLSTLMKPMSVTCHTNELAIPEINAPEFKIWLDGVYRGEVLSLDQCKFQAEEDLIKHDQPKEKTDSVEFTRRSSEEKEEYVKTSLDFLSGVFKNLNELCEKYDTGSEQNASIKTKFYNEIYDTMYHGLFNDLNIDRTVNEMINLGEVYATITMDFKLKPMNQNHALGDSILQAACESFINHLFGEKILPSNLRKYISINQTACCPYLVIKRDYDLLLKKKDKTPEEQQTVSQITEALSVANNYKGFEYILDSGQALHFAGVGISDTGIEKKGINREVQAKKYEALKAKKDMSNFDAEILSRNMNEVADLWLGQNIDQWLSMSAENLQNYLSWLSLEPQTIENFITNTVKPPIVSLNDSRLLALFNGNEQIFMEWKLWNSPVDKGLESDKVLKPLKNNRVSNYGKQSLALIEKSPKYNLNNENTNDDQLFKLKLINTFLESRTKIIV